jgi:hypothetical protein
VPFGRVAHDLVRSWNIFSFPKLLAAMFSTSAVSVQLNFRLRAIEIDDKTTVFRLASVKWF